MAGRAGRGKKTRASETRAPGSTDTPEPRTAHSEAMRGKRRRKTSLLSHLKKLSTCCLEVEDEKGLQTGGRSNSDQAHTRVGNPAPSEMTLSLCEGQSEPAGRGVRGLERILFMCGPR